MGRTIRIAMIVTALFVWPTWFLASTGHIAATGSCILLACVAFIFVVSERHRDG